MILTTALFIKWSRVNKNHYLSLGYEFTKMRDVIEIKVSELLPQSNYKILVKCDKCGDVYETKYYHHYNQVLRRGYYICRPCSASKDRTDISIVKDAFLKLGLEPLFQKYNNAFEKLPCKCIKHNSSILYVKYNHVQRGVSPCLECISSKGENKIREYLVLNNISFESEKKFKKCKDISHLKFDFYLPDYNLCIEFDGEQHFKPVSFGRNQSAEIKENNLAKIKRRDAIKNQYCKDNNIKLLRITYKQFKNIDDILNKRFHKGTGDRCINTMLI